MKKGEKQLLALIRIAIHPKDRIPVVLTEEVIDWEEIFEESKKQSLMGIAFIGFKVWNASDFEMKYKKNIDKRLLTQWAGICEKIREDNLLLNKRTAQVCKNFAKEGFRTSVMKGQGNALLYGDILSLMRSSGDIDVWVEGGFHKVYDYVRKVSPPTRVNELEMDFNVFSDAEVEVHYRPFILRHPFRNRKLQVFFNKQADACFDHHVSLQAYNKDGEAEMVDAFVTTLTFNLVHQLAHIHLHLFTEGVGLRQVMDYYYLLVHAETELSQEEKDEVISVVHSIKLDILAKALSWILSEYLGLEKKFQLWKPNKDDGEFLLEEIMQSGNFGSGDNRLPKDYSIGGIQSFFYVQRRNFRLSRFDSTDWFWGSLWRIYHFAWRRLHGFTH